MEWERQAESTLNAWAAAAQEGDEAARLALLQQFEPLIRGTAAWLWRGVIRSRLTDIYEQEDLTQETKHLFLELIQEHTLRRGRSFTPFMVTMLRWRARNFLSRAQRRRGPGARHSIDDEWTLEQAARLAAAWGVSQQSIRQALQRAHRSLHRRLATDTPPKVGDALLPKRLPRSVSRAL